MKTIGIVAVTAEGAADCYKKIVTLSAKKLGVNRHPEIVLINPSFETILSAQKQHDWPKVARILSDAANKTVAAGATFIIVPANSVHYAYDLIASEVSVPVLNVVDIVVDTCKQRGYKKAAVLGVGLTMSEGLYDKSLNAHAIKGIALTVQEKQGLDKIIYDELVHGVVNPDSVSSILSICNRLKDSGCEALILACSELPLIVTQQNSPLPLLDSTELLAEAAVMASLKV